MKIIKVGVFIALFTATFFVVGCELGTIKAEENLNGNPAQTEPEKAAINTNSSKTKSPATKVSSVVGTYVYRTEKDGEGYDNSLEIRAARNGKLDVYISGSNIYKNGETQSMHEAEGKGDAILKGNTATATLVDELDNKCRAVIRFGANRATVKMADSCRFNVSFDGVYKKSAAKSAAKQPNAVKTTKISFVDLADFLVDTENHRSGENFVVSDVPAAKIEDISRADGDGNDHYKNLYALDFKGDDANGSGMFLTSAALVKQLRTNKLPDAATLRVTATLVETSGGGDFYRSTFVTKIEVLDEDGELLWMAIGEQPVKIKFIYQSDW